jgi:hypothetical protein
LLPKSTASSPGAALPGLAWHSSSHGFEDLDGCPDPDNDHDGIPDEKDKCPNEPETINGFQDEDGCPDKGDSAIVLSPDRIETIDPIQFTGLKPAVARKFRFRPIRATRTPACRRCAASGELGRGGDRRRAGAARAISNSRRRAGACACPRAPRPQSRRTFREDREISLQCAFARNYRELQVGLELLMKQTDQWRGPMEEARTSGDDVAA